MIFPRTPFAAFIVLALIVTSQTLGQSETDKPAPTDKPGTEGKVDEASQPESNEGIETGTVILHGQLVDPPYQVTGSGRDIFINGSPVRKRPRAHDQDTVKKPAKSGDAGSAKLSDHEKAISQLSANFWTQVKLWKAEKLDPETFRSKAIQFFESNKLVESVEVKPTSPGILRVSFRSGGFRKFDALPLPDGSEPHYRAKKQKKSQPTTTERDKIVRHLEKGCLIVILARGTTVIFPSSKSEDVMKRLTNACTKENGAQTIAQLLGCGEADALLVYSNLESRGE